MEASADVECASLAEEDASEAVVFLVSAFVALFVFFELGAECFVDAEVEASWTGEASSEGSVFSLGCTTRGSISEVSTLTTRNVGGRQSEFSLRHPMFWT